MADYVVLMRDNKTHEVTGACSLVKPHVEDAIAYAKRTAESYKSEEIYFEVFRVIELTGASGGRKRIRFIKPPVNYRVEEF